jgi:hypothetical protein
LSDLIRRFRGLGVAVVVLAMSAGVVFAAAPHGQPASDRVPNAETPTSGTDEDESEAPETEAPETEAPETEAPDTEDPSEDADTDKAETDSTSGDNHGALVSAAAQMPTPDGFRNHGAFVSCVAHMKDATLATIDWTTVTPEACAAAKPGKGNDPEKQAAKDTAKAERDAAKAARAAAREAAKAARQAAKGH